MKNNDKCEIIYSFIKEFLAGFKSLRASITSSQLHRNLYYKAKVSPFIVNIFLRNLEEVCDNKNRKWKVIKREYRRNGIRIILMQYNVMQTYRKHIST